MRPVRRALAAGLVIAGAWQLGTAGWIHLKAVAAQALIRRAWTQTLADGGPHPPWPWADTVPVARLRIERLDVDLVALEGFSGQALAFGPGLRELDGDLTVLSAHRDTHFRFLAALAPGDTLSLERGDGTRRVFRVSGARVVDHRDPRALSGSAGPRLVLVTCWPLDAVLPGGPLRLVVTARPDAGPAAPPA